MKKISNGILAIGIREKGAELTSILDLRNNTEHLWQADPAGWGWHAPVLFPVVGRCLNDEINIGDKIYPMPKHGFARHLPFTCIQEDEQSICFQLTDNEETRKQYPFSFQFSITYKLLHDELHTIYEVKNTGEKILPFSLGAHPAFRLPFSGQQNYSGSQIIFEKPESAPRFLIDQEGFFTGESRQIMENGNLSLFPALFDEDALIFKTLESRSLLLEDNTSGKAIQLHFTGFPYLGIWSRAGAPFICLEPWLGCADTAGKKIPFNEKEGIIQLPVSEQFTASLVFRIINPS